jgi:dephospho-CoA kinase
LRSHYLVSTRNPYRVGLTGGIGSGKSTVARLFAAHAVDIIDADELAHRLSAPGGAAVPALRAAFGDHYITAEGSLDRSRMRQLAFQDDAARHVLEGILHPMIREATALALARSHSPYVLLVIPLLFESPSWRERIHRALVVDCPEEQQIERVMQRSGLAREDVLAIMARQVNRAKRLELADDVIDNSGGFEALEANIAALHHRYLLAAEDGSL